MNKDIEILQQLVKLTGSKPAPRVRKSFKDKILFDEASVLLDENGFEALTIDDHLKEQAWKILHDEDALGIGILDHEKTSVPTPEPGPQGDPGLPGKKGDKGDRGEKGDDGKQGLPGVPGFDGKDGETGLKGDVGDRGEPGEKGEKGDKGEQGETGEVGLQGEKGDKGDKGEDGAVGPKGDTGEKGDKGDQGEQGLKGDVGETGSKGDKGDQGIPGKDGADGKVGAAGKDGKDGATGKKGPAGKKGERGLKGKDGKAGKQGLRGDKGAKGDPGKQGETGDAGPQGEKGPKGDIPKHEWNPPFLRFELAEGEWGEWIDFRKLADMAAEGKQPPKTVFPVDYGGSGAALPEIVHTLFTIDGEMARHASGKPATGINFADPFYYTVDDNGVVQLNVDVAHTVVGTEYEEFEIGAADPDWVETAFDIKLDTEKVFLNGVFQSKLVDRDYTIINNNRIEFTPNFLHNGDIVMVEYQKQT
jgi:hypothetical protein